MFLHLRFALRRQLVLVLSETMNNPASSGLYIAAKPENVIPACLAGLLPLLSMGVPRMFVFGKPLQLTAKQV
jgi:hypothetical protein